jgi:hypothetical protein
MKSIEDLQLVPWSRYSWHGEWQSVDGTIADEFDQDDVALVLAHGSSNRSDWDGKEAAVIQLCDGRIVAWETWWGPTGNGFCDDAYGGDTNVLFAESVDAVWNYLTESARELLGGKPQ